MARIKDSNAKNADLNAQKGIELCKHNIKEHYNHGEFNCNECDFQTTTDLLRHKQLKHKG